MKNYNYTYEALADTHMKLIQIHIWKHIEKITQNTRRNVHPYPSSASRPYNNVLVQMILKKNQSTPRPSEHPPVMGEKMSKRLGGIKGCKYKTSSCHLNRFPDADNIGSTI